MSTAFEKLFEIADKPEDAVDRDTTQPTGKTFGKNFNFSAKSMIRDNLIRDIDHYWREAPELSIIDRNRRFRQLLEQAARTLGIGIKDIENSYEAFEDPAQKQAGIPALRLEVSMAHQKYILKNIKRETIESQRVLDGLGRCSKTDISMSFEKSYDEDHVLDTAPDKAPINVNDITGIKPSNCPTMRRFGLE